ncbi:MAG: hypothetical protein K0R87_1864 [Pseudonocardia sp.]|jgi:hypothetical protein|nr:hypothetical protein [Pseudonocardia sp.]
MRPRPHIGVRRSGSVLPSIVTMFSSVWGPIRITVMVSPGSWPCGRVGPTSASNTSA